MPDKYEWMGRYIDSLLEYLNPACLFAALLPSCLVPWLSCCLTASGFSHPDAL